MTYSTSNSNEPEFYLSRGSGSSDLQDQCHDPEVLLRLAKLVATGASTIPPDLDSESFSQLLTEVGRIRRLRLVQLIAQAIAKDLCRDLSGIPGS